MVVYQGTWHIEADPASLFGAAPPSADSVMAVLVPQAEGRELRFLNARFADDNRLVVELRLLQPVESPDWIRPTDGGFALTTLRDTPRQMELAGRAWLATETAAPRPATFHVTLARENQR